MISLPKSVLPENKYLREEILYNYFSERYIDCILKEDRWHIDIYFPDEEYYIDPDLRKGLSWWDKNISIADIPLATKDLNYCQVSLNDAWTLFSWSTWINNNRKLLRPGLELGIIHIDDHNDLMSPRIFYEGFDYYDLITLKKVVIDNPSTVSSAIKSGAIGMGSFFVPILYSKYRVSIFHLSNPSDDIIRYPIYKIIEKKMVHDTLLDLEKIRPDLTTSIVPNAMFNKQDCNHYSIHTDIKSLLECIPDMPLFLHIDMDYFCNRFNGDSNWQNNTNPNNYNKDATLKRIDNVLNNIKNSNVSKKIVNSTIALSPGFFPAEYWQVAIDKTLSYVKGYGKK